MAYSKEDLYDAGITEQIASHYREILRLLGEDPEREGLVKHLKEWPKHCSS